jgi:ubiquinone/menaquinone biosynthesis C-methylase UbiE
MKGNYSFVAPYYDYLSRIIFGDAIVIAQKFLVTFILPNSTILIVGGGTGWILEEIAKKHAAGLQIIYIDSSKKMIASARRKNFGNNKVIFINGDIREVAINYVFNIVITPFVLDNFSNSTTIKVFDKIHNSLSTGGHWLFTDFEVSEHGKLWQKHLLKAMYFFFKVACNIEATALPDTDTLFHRYRYAIVSSKTFFRNFIRSVVYCKSADSL